MTTTQAQGSAAPMVLFVCTGNTCRSPLAAVLFADLVARQLGCVPADLPGRGLLIASAGVAAWPGQPASPGAQAAARAMGLDLSNHRSQPVTPELLARTGLLFTMTSAHLSAIRRLLPPGELEPALLDPAGGEVADPFGGGPEDYAACAQHLRHLLQARLAGLASWWQRPQDSLGIRWEPRQP